MDFKSPIDEQDGWKLLERYTFNDRTLIAFYNGDDGGISLILTHYDEQPNELSKKSPYTTWGYVTYAVSHMHTCEEAAKVVGLYMKDMETDNFWWEKQ